MIEFFVSSQLNKKVTLMLVFEFLQQGLKFKVLCYPCLVVEFFFSLDFICAFYCESSCLMVSLDSAPLQIVHFRSLERPKEDDFCLEL